MADWQTTGNAATTPPVEFLGTTDNHPLVIKTNGAERVRIDEIGLVGIGTTDLEAPLTIVGGSLGPVTNDEFPLASFGFKSGNKSRLKIIARRLSDGDDWTSTSIGLQMDVDVTSRAGAHLWLRANGNVGIGTATPEAPLSVQGKSLGEQTGSETRIASLGFFPGGGNYSRLGIVAQRTAAGAGWTTASIGLQMDVDITPRSGAHLWLHANGNVGIGTSTPEANLSVDGDFLGSRQGAELKLASFAFGSINYSRLGIYALRIQDGNDWTSTAIGFGMDVDIAKRVGSSLWLHANGCATIGTTDSDKNVNLKILAFDEAKPVGLLAHHRTNVPGVAVQGLSSGNGVGVFAYSSSSYPGVLGLTGGPNAGIIGIAPENPAIKTNVGVYGVIGNTNPPDFELPPVADFAGGVGIFGKSMQGVGVIGVTSGSNDGLTTGANGVEGYHFGPTGAGVNAMAWNPTAVAFNATHASGGFAGIFKGKVGITGSLSAGSKGFRIDHPLDPSNKILNHWCVESDELLNFYSGIAATDHEGRAVVKLPQYFESLNGDFRYQLTPMGVYAELCIEHEVDGNAFNILSSRPNVRVSWQITGRRRDAYAQSQEFLVEEEKAASECGKFLYAVHGDPDAPLMGQLAVSLNKASITSSEKLDIGYFASFLRETPQEN